MWLRLPGRCRFVLLEIGFPRIFPSSRMSSSSALANPTFIFPRAAEIVDHTNSGDTLQSLRQRLRIEIDKQL